MIGKHSEEQLKIKRLENAVKLKEQEIKDIKYSLIKTLQHIRDLNESNEFGDSSARKRKISELCTDTIYELYLDEIDNFYKKEAKIIQLPTNRQVSK